MLKKLIAVAAAATLAKKAWDSYKARPSAEEQEALDAMASEIEPQGSARKGRKGGSRRARNSGPSAA